MKNNIFIFWYGPQNESVKKNFLYFEKELAEKFILKIGPSKKEHEEWIEKYDFYKKCFQKKDYAFMADFARVKWLLDNGGIYLDANTLINFFEFKKEFQYKKIVNLGLTGEKNDITNSFLCAPQSHFFLNTVLNIYKNWNFKKYDYKLVTGPTIYTIVAKILKIKPIYNWRKTEKFLKFRPQSSWKKEKQNWKFFKFKIFLQKNLFWKINVFLPFYFFWPKRAKQIYQFSNDFKKSRK